MTDNLTNEEIFELKNLENVKHIVSRSENPHPLIIVLIIIGSILLIYFCYITFMKKTLSGQWLDEKNNIFIIKHNLWKDTLIIDGPNNSTYGVVKGNLIVIYVDSTMKMGVCLNDNIEWVDGSSWHCIYG
jgi:hypothetical protein